MTSWRALAVAALVAAAAASTAAQVFRGGVEIVSLNVTVVEGESRLVPGLAREKFHVFEDGVEQQITFFSRDPQPIALSILLDTSTSMEHKLEVAQEGAIGFANRLTPKDVAQIIDFDSRPEILQTFTNDAKLLGEAIGRAQVGGSTALYNALYIALSELKRHRATSTEQIRRQAVIVLSDGEDTSSLIDYESVLDSARRSEVAVYAIGLRAKDDRPGRAYNEAEFVLRKLSEESGGRVHFVDEVRQLPAIYAQIADELANQYTVGYTTRNAKRDGAWRTVIVRVDHPNATARTKRGYFAPTVKSSAK